MTAVKTAEREEKGRSVATSEELSEVAREWDRQVAPPQNEARRQQSRRDVVDPQRDTVRFDYD
jgi:hypothetical protein